MKSLCIAWMIVVALPTTLLAREWTDATGAYRREAEFLAQRDGEVWLRDSAGKTYVVSPERLSAADRTYLAGLESQNIAPDGSRDAQTKTLAFRLPSGRMPIDAAVQRRIQRALTQASVTRLTGWHCYGGHCHVTTHHHPPYPPPAPPAGPKRIFHGCYSTFHLVNRLSNQIGGSGAYKFWVGGVVVEYLELLRFSSQSTPPGQWLEYSVARTNPPLGITHWWFADISVAPCWYGVYYRTTAGYTFYEYACRRVPR
ncbi:MAG: SHD1 domain-containing protein [Pirellulales bacterium]